MLTKAKKFQIKLIVMIVMATVIAIVNMISRNGNHYTLTSSSNISWYSFVVSYSTLVLNVLSVVFFGIAYGYQYTGRQRKATVAWMELGNVVCGVSFAVMFIGFAGFISALFKFSLWLHVISMLSIFLTCNMLVRIFAVTNHFSKDQKNGNKVAEITSGTDSVL